MSMPPHPSRSEAATCPAGAKAATGAAGCSSKVGSGSALVLLVLLVIGLGVRLVGVRVVLVNQLD